MSKPDQIDASDPPVGLAERLKALGGPRVAVPPRTDETILAQARQHFAGMGRWRRVIAFPRWQGGFKNRSRRREEAEFSAKGCSASLPRRLRGARAILESTLPRWLAAAAVVALCAWLGHLWWSAPSNSSVSREDINHDGRVDILDAFAVARRLQQGQVDAARFDINRDGLVDQRDIDLIAVEAVKLAKGAG